MRIDYPPSDRDFDAASFETSKASRKNIPFFKGRFFILIACILVLASLLIARMIFLTVFNRPFLLHQGQSRFVRTMRIPAYRGMILDRNGDPLAVSTPVDSIWINPKDFPKDRAKISQLSALLKISANRIQTLLKHNKDRQFVYLIRGLNPSLAKSVKQLGIPGVYLQREYRRYYPDSEVAAHLVGFTNIDDKGQEGMEFAFNQWLSGTPGEKRVLKDRYGHVVAVMADIRPASPGHDLRLSIDSRIQFLAYRVLNETVTQFNAESGTVIVLNPQTGEILAMVNQPSYNPNKRTKDIGQYRNRAVTDIFEPGSTMKVFSIASGLDSGQYEPDTLIDTHPGWFKVGKNIVRDEHLNYGKISVTEVLQKSSNVGVAKMVLSLPPDNLLDLLRRLGFGQRTRGGFPGERSGIFPMHDRWRPFDLATLAFGYSISVTPLQLAHAYSVIANDGLSCPVSFLYLDRAPICHRVLSEKVARQMQLMLNAVMQKGGTGTRARIKGYKVAGKTGTAYIAGPHGYDQTQHMSSFVGMAPLNDPQLVVAVIIHNPKHGYYGALVAAPAFKKIMAGALAILDIPPDDVADR